MIPMIDDKLIIKEKRRLKKRKKGLLDLVELDSPWWGAVVNDDRLAVSNHYNNNNNRFVGRWVGGGMSVAVAVFETRRTIFILAMSRTITRLVYAARTHVYDRGY